MNELANTTNMGLATLDELAIQAEVFSCGAAMNLLQLGRVLCEAKPQTKHGEWEDWVKRHAHMPPRRAQEYMQAYRKFGTDQRVAQLGPSQIIALLPMTDDEREELMAENDVGAMTSRESDGAIRAQREKRKQEAMAEARSAIEEAEKGRRAAEARCAELAARPPEIPEELTEELKRSRSEIERLAETARNTLEDANRMREERAGLEREMAEQETILQEQQEALNRAQAELLNLKSAQARGDAERPERDDLTLETLNQAAREFMGLCARGPYMGATFAAMGQKEKAGWSETLRAVIGLCEGTMRALSSVAVEGGIIVE